jgi:hypothetical protein
MPTRRKLLLTAAGVPLVGAASAALALRSSQRSLGDWLADLRPDTTSAQPPFQGPLDRLAVHDTPYFWAGVNYPWKTGQDFGTGGWGHSGVSDPTTYQEIDVDFANMAAQGVRVIKWRVFSDGRYSPEFDKDGTVTGLDEFFYPDLDAALEIAYRHDVYLVLTLFSSGFWTADCQSGGVQMGGHSATMVDPAKRRSLIDRAIVPMLKRLAFSNRVVAFEIIAEPEWGVQELHTQEDARIKLPQSAVRDFIADVARAIRQNSRALITVESNRFSNMRAWQGLRLDYYSYSWYDWLEPYEPLSIAAATAGLDRPVVLGEFPAGGSSYYELPKVLDMMYGNGYAGGFAWSYWGGDGLSQWRKVSSSFTDWARQHWDDVDIGSAAAPGAGPITEQPYPYRYTDLTVRAEGTDVIAELRIDVASGEPYVPHAYLYDVGSAQPREDVRLSAAPGQPGRLAAHFTQVEPGKPYSISIGLFNRTDTLRKWFGNITTFALQDGQIAKPQIDTLAGELGCTT